MQNFGLSVPTLGDFLSSINLSNFFFQELVALLADGHDLLARNT
jgi:hypothetical protein